MPNEVGGSVVWNLDVEKGKLSEGLRSARSEVEKTADFGEKRFSSMAKSMTNSMKLAENGSKMFATGLLAVGASLGSVLGLGLKTAGEFETLQTALETVTGSSDLASKAMETIKKTAKDSPFFEVGTLAQFVQLMAASGQKIDDAIASGIKFGDVTAAFGKGNFEMARMGNTLSQVIGKGKADIIDFKELVNAGWVSVRTDTAKAMGVTMAQFEEMVSAGLVGYDQISKAAEKFAGSAEKQSGNMRALWSRLKETISTTFANIVIDTGFFDKAKLAITGLITAIESISTQDITDFFNNLKDNLPIITGIIAGGLTPAVYGLAASFIAATLPLLPFIAAGALLGLGIKLIIDQLGGWDAAQQKITTALKSFTDAFNTYVKPALDSLISTVKENLLPELAELWRNISPIMIPALKLFASILGGVVIISLRAVLEVIKLIVSGLTDMIQKFNDAWNSISKTAEKIRGALDKINPYHRESPSLVDNVKSGVNKIINQYKSLSGISLPPISTSMSSTEEPSLSPSMASGGDTSSTNNQSIVVNVASISDSQDIDMIARQIGYKVALLPK